MQNSIQDVITYLKVVPFSTETQIQKAVWSYDRANSIRSNKKYADMLRRGLDSGKVARVKANVKGIRSQYFYYIPK